MRAAFNRAIYGEKPTKNVKLVCIGMSGMGKSTLLNYLAAKKDGGYNKAFVTSSRPGSCTQHISYGKFAIEVADPQVPRLDIDLTDSMGFPDTNPANCKKYYDTVVSECNRPQNAIVWVHKATRLKHTDVNQMRALLREFNRASVPIILVINGTENYPDDLDPTSKEREKEEHRLNHLEMGQLMANEVGVQLTAILAGADIHDLGGCIKLELAKLLSMTETRPSDIKTLARVKSEMVACKTEAEKAHHEAVKTREAQDKLRRDRQDLEAYQKKMQESRGESGKHAGTALGAQIVCGVGMCVCLCTGPAGWLATSLFVASEGAGLAGLAVCAHAHSTEVEEGKNRQKMQDNATQASLAASEVRKAANRQMQQKALEQAAVKAFNDMEDAFPV